MKRHLFFLFSFLIWSFPLAIQAHQSGTEQLLTSKVKLVEKLNANAKEALLKAAKKPEFGQYFAANSAKEKERLKAAIDQQALAISKMFGADEVCVIDIHGTEISRVFSNKIADDLSHHERKNIFFRGGMSTKYGEVFLSPPYISDDTHEWVIGYSTRIRQNNQVKGILHLERSLRELQRELYSGFKDDPHFIVAIDDGGWIIADSRREIRIKRKGKLIYPGNYFKRFVLSDLDFRTLTKGENKGKGTVGNIGGAYFFSFEKIGSITLIAFEAKN